VSTPELYKEYPIVMSSGYRQPFYFLGQYRNIPWLRSFMEFPTCQLHPETAKLYNVEDGDIIWIESAGGRIRQKLRTFPASRRASSWPRPTASTRKNRRRDTTVCSSPTRTSLRATITSTHVRLADLTCLLCKVYKTEDEDLKEEVFRTRNTASCRRA